MVKSIYKRFISATLVAVLSMSLVACGDTRVAKREDNLTNNVKAVSVEHKELDEAFVKATADFNVFLHKTYIELDRNGTKAAAITLVGNEKGEDVVAGYVILDRPFFYAIIDCKTGLPVFMGVVNSIN